MQKMEDIRSNVTSLLKAVVDTNQFEKHLISRFGGLKVLLIYF